MSNNERPQASLSERHVSFRFVSFRKASEKLRTGLNSSEHVRKMKKNLRKLEKFSVQIIVCGKYKVNIKKLLSILKKKGIKNILVEGGGTINWAFVKENLVDEAIITITPYLVGGITATTLVDGDGFSTITKSIKLKLKNISKMKNEVILHYEN